MLFTASMTAALAPLLLLACNAVLGNEERDIGSDIDATSGTSEAGRNATKGLSVRATLRRRRRMPRRTPTLPTPKLGRLVPARPAARERCSSRARTATGTLAGSTAEQPLSVARERERESGDRGEIVRRVDQHGRLARSRSIGPRHRSLRPDRRNDRRERLERSRRQQRDHPADQSRREEHAPDRTRLDGDQRQRL